MKHHLGFTLIEALAATALAAIMMVAVTSVVSALARHDTLTDTDPHTDWRRQLTRVIQRDLQHAQQYHSQDNKLTLTGPVSLDAGTLKPTHHPAIVTYQINEYAGQSWLLRTQTDPDSRALNNAWTQLVCRGVRGLAVMDVPQSAGVIASPESHIDGSETETISDPQTLWVPVKTVTLSLAWAGPEQPASSTTLLIR